MTDKNERVCGGAEKTVRDIRRATRRKVSAEEKNRIGLEGQRGDDYSIADMAIKRRGWAEIESQVEVYERHF